MIATAYRIIENNALLAAFEAVTDHAGYWPAFVAVEGRVDAEERNGRFDEADRVRAEMVRINYALRPMLTAQYRAIKTYSLAGLMARAEASTTQHEAA